MTMAKKKRKLTDDDRAFLEQMRVNAERTRRLAEKRLAGLPESVREERERAGSNAAWLRQLAEKAQAELDRRDQQRESA
jgi:hypothetical protein